jgi:hypothetical protein
MTATLTRGEVENLPVDSIFLEMQALKLAHDATVTDFAATALICLYGLVDAAIAPGFKPTKKHLSVLSRLLKKWTLLFSRFVRDDKDRAHILHGVERASLHAELLYLPFFRFSLQLLYDCSVLSEDVILEWEGERRASSSAQDVQLLESAKEFLEWLNEASDSDEDESDDD